MSVNQLLCFYLIPDRLFGLCNSLLSAHVKKVALSCVCVCLKGREKETRSKRGWRSLVVFCFLALGKTNWLFGEELNPWSQIWEGTRFHFQDQAIRRLISWFFFSNLWSSLRGLCVCCTSLQSIYPPREASISFTDTTWGNKSNW